MPIQYYDYGMISGFCGGRNLFYFSNGHAQLHSKCGIIFRNLS
jgi:hypothetical protein